jgi:ribose-phosphate pyrophosphokinase
MLVFAPLHTRALGERIAAALGEKLSATEEREHDFGEHKMRPAQDVTGHDVYVVQSLHGDAGASTNDKLCRLLFFLAALRDAGAARVTACVPYLCYARKDRRTGAQDPVTLRYVATLFEAMRVDRVVVLDVHNEAAFDNAFRCTSLRIDADALLLEQLQLAGRLAEPVIASPDIGGFKRVQRLQDTLASQLGKRVDFAFMEKRRSGGVLSGERLVGEVADRDVLIFDDMIASGSTILRATAAARKAGARSVHVAATHAAFNAEATRLGAAEGPDTLLVTDSIEVPPHLAAALPQLNICPIATLFANTIQSLAGAHR